MLAIERSHSRESSRKTRRARQPTTSSKSSVAKANPTTSQSSSGNKCLIQIHVRLLVDLTDVDVVSSFTARFSFRCSGMGLVRPEKLIGGERVDRYKNNK